jgi:hypothetical protein
MINRVPFSLRLFSAGIGHIDVIELVPEGTRAVHTCVHADSPSPIWPGIEEAKRGRFAYRPYFKL